MVSLIGTGERSIRGRLSQVGGFMMLATNKNHRAVKKHINDAENRWLQEMRGNIANGRSKSRSKNKSKSEGVIQESEYLSELRKQEFYRWTIRPLSPDRLILVLYHHAAAGHCVEEKRHKLKGDVLQDKRNRRSSLLLIEEIKQHNMERNDINPKPEEIQFHFTWSRGLIM